MKVLVTKNCPRPGMRKVDSMKIEPVRMFGISGRITVIERDQGIAGDMPGQHAAARSAPSPVPCAHNRRAALRGC